MSRTRVQNLDSYCTWEVARMYQKMVYLPYKKVPYFFTKKVKAFGIFGIKHTFRTVVVLRNLVPRWAQTPYF